MLVIKRGFIKSSEEMQTRARLLVSQVVPVEPARVAAMDMERVEEFGR